MVAPRLDGDHHCRRHVQHEEYLSWIQSCFSNPEDPYDAVWHDKLGFASVQNGDVLAVHLDPERAGWITYLSHEDGAHGYVMARSLSDLVERWVPLACPGPEDWQWLPFVPVFTCASDGVRRSGSMPTYLRLVDGLAQLAAGCGWASSSPRFRRELGAAEVKATSGLREPPAGTRSGPRHRPPKAVFGLWLTPCHSGQPENREVQAMRMVLGIATAVVLLAMGCAGNGGETTTLVTPTGETVEVVLPAPEELQATLEAGLAEHGGTGFTFAVIMADGTGWRGVAGVSHGSTPVTHDMAFAVGSITKTWTAATILQLAEEGVLELDDPVSAWLPPYPHVNESITIRQLLGHTSGLHNFIDHPDYWQSVVWDEPGRSWTPAEAITTYLQEPYFAPGTDWRYSNSGYALLRMIITEATGDDIATVYQDRFFDPLGLDGTFVIIDQPLPANAAHGWWDLDGDGAYDDFSSTPYTAFSSGIGGQVFSTAEDLADWTHALYHDRTVLDRASFAAMTDFRPVAMEDEPLLAGYGLGAVRFAPELVSGLEVWGHGGNAPGYSAGAFYLVDYGISMGFADNTEHGLAIPLIDDMLGLIVGIHLDTPQ